MGFMTYLFNHVQIYYIRLIKINMLALFVVTVTTAKFSLILIAYPFDTKVGKKEQIGDQDLNMVMQRGVSHSCCNWSA